MSQDPPDKDPLIGSVVDRRYKVLKRLGVGGMGIVYKVEHSYLNKFFALKVMRTTKDETDRKRFEQEARLASQIRHPNVVEISDFGVLPTSQPYFVMEFLRGHTIGDAIYTGFIDSQLICHIGVQISRGLQAVHKQNVVHRDLKPDNIFLIDPEAAEATESPDGNDDSAQAEPAFVKIMDFGIAKSMNNNLTGTGMTVGTPEYMSPEQARGEPVDWRSDQYSLGCILYEMLTREIPFDGKGAFEVMYKHLNAAPMPPRQRRPERADYISPQLEAIVLKMLGKKPKERHSSMRAVEHALRDEASRLLLSSHDTVIGPAPLPPPGPNGRQTSDTIDTKKTVPIMRAVSPPDSSNNRPTRKIDVQDQAGMIDIIGRIGGIVHSPRSVALVKTPAGPLGRVRAWLHSLWDRLRKLWK
jgi:serine/threonine protein kinase